MPTNPFKADTQGAIQSVRMTERDRRVEFREVKN